MIIGKKFHSLSSAISKVGLNKWVNSKDNLISHKEITLIHKYIFDNYCKIFCKKKLNKEKYFLGLANIKIINYLSVKLVNQLILTRLNRRGIYEVLLYDKKTISLKKFLDDREYFSEKFFIKKNSIFIKLIKNIFTLFRLFYYYLSFSKKKIIYNINSPKKEFVKFFCDNENYYQLRFDRFNYVLTDNNLNLDKTSKKFIESQTKFFFKKLKKKFPFIKNDFENELIFNTKKKLENSLNYIRITSKNLIGSNKVFVSYANGSPVNRAFIAACRLSNLETIGLSHGNPYLLSYNSYERIFNDSSSISEKVYLNSLAEKSNIKKQLKNFQNIIDLPKLIYPQKKKNIYYKKFNIFKKNNFVKKIKKVMIVGMPYKVENMFYVTNSTVLNTHERLRLEIKLIEVLKKNGFHILYKIHPGFNLDYNQIFQNLSVEIINEKFEDSYRLADCIVYSYSSSSTLGYGLMTSKPIVIFDEYGNIRKHDKHLFSLLKKRCSIIHPNIGKFGSISFDEKKFIREINKSASLNNFDVVKKYAIG